jgi:diguanylate cyclase (GGDEF)-like protein/PAS domain S-box-containing protein
MRSVFDRNPTGQALLDAEGHFVAVNQALCRFLGRSPGELVGASYALVMPPNEASILAPGPAERRYVHAEGRMVWGRTTTAVIDDLGSARLLLCVEDITGQRIADQSLIHAALHDSLTDLPNRRLLRDRLTTALARSGRSEAMLAVMFIDLDGFKKINDTMGHEAGDDLLVAVSQNLVGILRGSDTIARLGGDEFVIVCEDVSDEEDLELVANRLLEAVRTPINLRGRRVSITASMGIAIAGPMTEGPHDLLRLADTAMYRAKRNGRDRYFVVDEQMMEQVTATSELEAELRHAIQADELTLYYQPVALVDGRLVGMEALVRWNHPRLGLLGPAEFLHVAETGDLSRSLSDWVLRTAVADAATWTDPVDRVNRVDGSQVDPATERAAPPVRVSVNLAVRELTESSFIDNVAGLLRWAGLAPYCLLFDISEEQLADPRPGLRQQLDRLRALGVGVAVDDFGIGSSSLADLKRLPVDTVKIDKSFAWSVLDDTADAAIVAAIAATSRATGRQTVAEGVESAAQLGKLRELGCDSVQGYFPGAPAPLHELREVLLNRRVTSLQS